MLRKDKFVWNEKAQHVFEALKIEMISLLVLAFIDFQQPFIIEIDACASSIGMILLQKGHPLAYFNKKLIETIQNSSAYARELFVIMKTISK